MKGRKFKKTAFTEDEHAHCLFDAKRITNCKAYLDFEDCDMQGYRSTDGAVWICEDCYDAICELGHKLKIEPNTVKEIKTALNSRQKVVLSLNNVQYEIKGESEHILVLHNGETSEYENFAQMEQKQKFYGKLLKDIIDEVFVGSF